ncbi:SLBB domain-containing protein [Candidatus Poribacteria bacterium]|nr:SLBB domain-containing protein [Candidatus Poribacteria bacterium]
MKNIKLFKSYIVIVFFLSFFYIGNKNIFAEQIEDFIDENKETISNSNMNESEIKEKIKSKNKNITNEKAEEIKKNVEVKKETDSEIKDKAQPKTWKKNKNRVEGKSDNKTEKKQLEKFKYNYESSIIENTGVEDNSFYSKIPSLSNIYTGRVMQVLDQDVKPFGYDVFNVQPSSFAPLSNISVSPDYILGPGDNIIIDIWGGYTNQIVLAVDSDGKIVLPSVGTVYLAGVEFAKLKDIIKEKLKKEYQNIDVEVTMGRLRTIQVYLVGELLYPGSYDISSLSTVYNAIIFAGGPSENGSLRNIEVIRNKQVIAKVDFYNFLLTGQRTDDIRLQDGDTVFVHLISNTAKIIGMVKRPAIYEFQTPMKLSRFIELAGGILPTGYLKNIQIERVIDNEKKIILNLNVSDEQKSDLDKFTVQDKDIINVFPVLSVNNSVIYLSGHVYRPGKYELKQGMTLKDIISSYDLILPEPAEYAQIIRLEKPAFNPLVITFNLSELLKGRGEQVVLQPHDTIIIFSKWKFQSHPVVYIEGAVRKSGVYELIKGMKISDLIYMGGGLNKSAYMNEAQLFRIGTGPKRELLKINIEKVLEGDEKENIELRDEDQIVIRDILDIKDVLTVSIEGEVRKPGVYPLIKDMTVMDLLSFAGNTKKDAFPDEYQIIRTRKDRKVEVLTYNLREALSGNKDHNVLLADEDNVIIKNIWNIKEKKFVMIDGEIMKPGEYRLGENMTLRDLIIQAEGIKDSAYLIEAEVIRYNPMQKGIETNKINVNLQKVMDKDHENNIILQDKDKVFIRKISNWEDIGQVVEIKGEVQHPGIYTIKKDESLSSLIQRAGGFLESAYLEGSVFSRQSVKAMQKARLEEMASRLEQEILRAGTKEAAANVSAEGAQNTTVVLQAQKDLIEKLKKVEPTGRMVIHLKQLNDLKDSKDDLILKNGDMLVIPKKPDFILITGEVYNPTALIFEGNNTKYYLNKVGGPTKNADKDDIYIVRTDGTVLSSEVFSAGVYRKWWNPYTWWGTSLLNANLSPGDTILVPEKVEVSHILRDVKDVTSVIYNIAVAAGVWKTIK